MTTVGSSCHWAQRQSLWGRHSARRRGQSSWGSASVHLGRPVAQLGLRRPRRSGTLWADRAVLRNGACGETPWVCSTWMRDTTANLCENAHGVHGGGSVMSVRRRLAGGSSSWCNGPNGRCTSNQGPFGSRGELAALVCPLGVTANCKRVVSRGWKTAGCWELVISSPFSLQFLSLVVLRCGLLW